MKNETPKSFKKAYGRIPGDFQQQFQKIMSDMLGWSKQLFSFKKNGMRGLSPTEEEKIENLFLMMGLDAWTGEKLNK